MENHQATPGNAGQRRATWLLNRATPGNIFLKANTSIGVFSKFQNCYKTLLNMLPDVARCKSHVARRCPALHGVAWWFSIFLVSANFFEIFIFDVSSKKIIKTLTVFSIEKRLRKNSIT